MSSNVSTEYIKGFVLKSIDNEISNDEITNLDDANMFDNSPTQEICHRDINSNTGVSNNYNEF